MSLFQITAVLFAIFMMYVVRIHQKKAHLSVIESSFWYSLWFLFCVLAIFPDLLLGVSQILYFDRVFDLLIVGAFMVLSVLVILTYFRYLEMDAKLEEIIRKNAVDTLTKRLKKS